MNPPEEILRVSRPCGECPWRRDTPPGQFPASRYAELRRTSGEPGREAGLDAPLFACHASPDDAPRACAGWLAAVGLEHLGVRLAVLRGLIPGEAIRPGPDWPPLFPSYREMAARQGRPENNLDKSENFLDLD